MLPLNQIYTVTCSVCHESKGPCEFVGFKKICRDCSSKKMKERRQKDPMVQWAKKNPNQNIPYGCGRNSKA